MTPAQLQLSPKFQQWLRQRASRLRGLEVNDEFAVVVKLPRAEAQDLSHPDARAAAALNYALMPTAPVLRLGCDVLPPRTIRLMLLVYLNVADLGARRLIEHLGRQSLLTLHILDDTLQTVRAKEIAWDEGLQREAQEHLARALADLKAIPNERYDFSQAQWEFEHRRTFAEQEPFSGEAGSESELDSQRD